MKTATILFIVGLIMSPVIGSAQTSNVPVPSTTNITSSQTTAVSPIPVKCGVNTFVVNNECGVDAFKNAYVQCYDDYETTLGDATSCKSSETWQQYAKDVCVNRCPTGKEQNVIPKPLPVPTPVLKPISVCYISDNLMQEYDRLILELQKAESDKVKVEEITKKIIALKQEIEKQRKECANAPQPTTTSRPVPLAPPIAIDKPITVSVNRCDEVAQWENKISYYKKFSGASDADLKKGGFSREEIEKILKDLSFGLEKIKAQCSNQSGTITAPPTTITGSVSATETVKPIVVESGQEISVYYKTRLEKTTTAKGEEKQIEELKALRDEIDGLITNLIKSRKELEVSELNTLVKEVKVSPGEIKADNVTVKTTEKKMLVNVGDRPVSIEPTASQVLIRDKGLEVKTDEATIKENVLSVGGVKVKMSASEVAEKLNLAPKSVELKEENARAVYNMKIEERRKLLGFIPFNIQKTVAADAANGNVLTERLPWYSFLTTK
jgi:DNA-binding transcriptional MerR regulator